MDELTAALVEEATKKSGMLWIALPGLPLPRGAWHIWHEGAAYVLTGGEGEQPLPGLPEADRVTVTVRSKDKGGRLVSWVAAVEEVRPGTELWDAVTPRMAKERLNAAGHQQQGLQGQGHQGQGHQGQGHQGQGLDGQIQRWARESYIIRLTPTGEVTEAPGAQRDDYAAVRPAGSPATTVGRNPFMIGGKRRKADR